MEIKKTGIDGLVEIVPQQFRDERGLFFESYHQKKLDGHGLPSGFVQDNQSFSRKGVLRGLHFQKHPSAQGKLVRVIMGKALDVVADLRPGSSTFGQSFSLVLDSQLNNMLYVPEGFAHGFLALEDCIFFYKCTAYYDKSAESGIIWNDPDLRIDWKTTSPVLSAKDLELPTFSAFKESLGIN